MTQPLLVLRTRGAAGNPAVFRMIGATTTGNQVGNTFGTFETNFGATVWVINRVVQFRADLYAFQNAGVYKFDGASTWNIVLTLSPVMIPSGEWIKTGLYVVPINGVPNLVALYAATGGTTIQRIKSADGTSWNTLAITFGAWTTASLINHQHWHRNVLYMRASFPVSGATMFFDPSTDAIGSIATIGLGVVLNQAVTFTYNKRLYLMGTTNTASPQMYESVAGGWFQRFSFGHANSNNNQDFGCVLVDPTDGFLYCFMFNNTNLGYVAYKVGEISGQLALISDLTTTVVPVALRSGLTTAAKLQTFADQETTPGSTTWWLYYAPNATLATQFTCFQWINNLTEILQVDQGSDVAMAIPNQSYGGAERIWTAGRNGISIEAQTPVSGGVRLSFKLWGTGTASVRFYFSLREEDPRTSCTLSNPSTGSLSGGTQVDTLSVDNGVTTYQVTWLSQSDGVPNFERVRFVARVF